MQFVLILLVVLGGAGLSVEAGILGPLGQEVGKLWATFSIFGVGAALTFLLMLFFGARNAPSFFDQPAWTLTGGMLGVAYVVVLALAVPIIGIAVTMIGILAGQLLSSMLIDHFGWLGVARRKIDRRRVSALCFALAALGLISLDMGAV